MNGSCPRGKGRVVSPPQLIRDGQSTTLDLTAHPPLGVAPPPIRRTLCAFGPVTGCYLSPMGTWSGGRRESTWKGSWRVPATGIVVRLSKSWPTMSWRFTARRLHDDATALCIDWCGPSGERTAAGGASRGVVDEAVNHGTRSLVLAGKRASDRPRAVCWIKSPAHLRTTSGQCGCRTE